MLDKILSADDAARANNVLCRLHAHDISRWALTGGFAIELHILRSGGHALRRPFHDMDFLVSSFDCIPETLSRDFLFRHVHPDDPPAKTLLQAMDPEAGVRVDVFRAYGFEMDRLSSIELDRFRVRVVSLPDLAARHARLCWDLVEGKQVHPKYVRDFLRLMEVAPLEDVENLWPEHRKPHFPESFPQAAADLERAIATRQELMVAWNYSTNAAEVCLRCREATPFPLASVAQIRSILGYV